jgi:hypothetical protein
MIKVIRIRKLFSIIPIGLNIMITFLSRLLTPSMMMKERQEKGEGEKKQENTKTTLT